MVVLEGSWEFFLGFGFWLVGFDLGLGCLSLAVWVCPMHLQGRNMVFRKEVKE